VTRVRYFERQRLRAEDLRAEQEYLIALERRHNLAQHGPGIVCGLNGGEDWFDATHFVRPGVAVDEEGRVLVLGKAKLEVGLGEAWLVPCETPLRRRGSCEHDRLAEQVRVVTGASAPVEGAIALGGESLRYTYLTASQVKDPARRAVMQVGPATGRDRNGFAVSTTDAAGVLAPRIALDRLGTNFLLGTTTVAGYRASAEIALSGSETLFVIAKRPGPQGERISAQLKPEAGQQGPVLRVRFFDGPTPSPVELLLPEEGRTEVIKDFNAQSELVTVRLSKPFSVPTRNFAVLAIEPQLQDDADAPAAEADPVQPPAEATLKARGSTIDLASWPQGAAKDDKKHVVGCVERLSEETSLGRGPNGLSFTPMAEAAKAPPMPGMWSVETGTAEAPSDELRLDLGAVTEGDASVRFTLGHRDADGMFDDWIKIRGTSSVTVQNLHVTGQTRVAPLRADHTDRNFATLLVRAYLDGLEAAIDASTDIILAFADLPALIKTGDPWKYKVMITNNTGRPITAGRLLETLTPEGDTAPLSDSLTLNTTINPGGPQLLAEMTHPEGLVPPGMLTVDVRTSGKKGDVPWRTPGTPLKVQIPVVSSPALELDDIPESVPANQPWTQSFVIRNNAGVPVTLTSVTMQENANPPQPVMGPPNIAANGFATFGPMPHAGIANDLDVVVAATITWPDATVSPISQPKTIRVRDDLDILVTVVDPPSSEQLGTWRYDLTIFNKTTHDITVTALRQRLDSADFDAVFPTETILIPADVIVPANGAVIFENVEIELQAPAQAVDLTIAIDYQREDQLTFTFTDTRGGINVS
jgi:hypothetical protein